MIIVEGPDGAGKTTLIETIRKSYPDLQIAPRVVSKDAEAMVDLQSWVNINLANGFQYELFDRHRLISEFVYGPLLRKKQSAGFTSLSWVANSLARFYALRPVVIYCLPPLEVIENNLRGDESNRVVWEHVEGMYTSYLHRASLDAISIGAILYDYTRHGMEGDPLAILHHPINEAFERANS